MSQNNSILSFFNLKDKNIEIIGHTSQRQPHGWLLHTIEGRLTYTLKRCPYCGFEGLIKNGTSLSHVRLGSTNGDKYVLNLHRQRYLCHQCKATCGAKTKIVKPNQTLSRPVTHEVIALARDMLTTKEIAKLVGISESSVQRLINTNVHITWRVKHLPENLSFDEFRSCGSKFSFICCDAETHHQIALLDGRLSRTIIDYFVNRYSLKERQAVRSVVVDMNAEYLNFIHQIFPNAVTIIDRFHIIQLTGRALDSERIKIQNSIEDKHSRQYRLIKSQWRLFHLFGDDINDSKPVYLRGINEYMTQQNAVDLVLSQNAKFSQVYQTYQAILKAVRLRDTNLLAEVLTNYSTNGSQMDVAIRTLRKQQTAVLNSCRFPYSNGPIEGLNRKIKTLKRNCFGFRNLKNFFTRITLILA